MNDNPMTNRINITPRSLFVDLELPINSFQINTPHKAAIIGAPCPSVDAGMKNGCVFTWEVVE